jgi:hypothetical protein
MIVILYQDGCRAIAAKVEAELIAACGSVARRGGIALAFRHRLGRPADDGAIFLLLERRRVRRP